MLRARRERIVQPRASRMRHKQVPLTEVVMGSEFGGSWEEPLNWDLFEQVRFDQAVGALASAFPSVRGRDVTSFPQPR